MSVVVFESKSISSQTRHSRETYRFASHANLPQPFCLDESPRNDQAWVCLRESDDIATSLVVECSLVTMTPTFLVYRPPVLSAALLATELEELRMDVDRAWRRRAFYHIDRTLHRSAPTRSRFVVALAHDGVPLPAANYCATLPASAKRIRPPRATYNTGVNLRMKEVLDWVFYLRVVAGYNIGVNLTQRVEELGGSLRSFRRICNRLRPWISHSVCRASPQMVIDALVRRLAPISSTLYTSSVPKAVVDGTQI